jgi:multisubunit Na+/H+ antiporter MnhF subunit
LVGIGPEVFFNDRWNCIDAIMIIMNVIFFFVKTGNKFDDFIRLFRFFRLIGFVKTILCSRYLTRQKIEIV